MIHRVRAVLDRLNASTAQLKHIRAEEAVRNGDHVSAPLPERNGMMSYNTRVDGWVCVWDGYLVGIDRDSGGMPYKLTGSHTGVYLWASKEGAESYAKHFTTKENFTVMTFKEYCMAQWGLV